VNASTGLRLRLRDLVPADRARVAAITRATGLFRAEELDIALEVFDAALGLGLDAGPDPSYTLLGAEGAGGAQDGELVGWICWGPTPCTVGTYDLYWMAVDPALQRAGVGRALLGEMEHRLAGVARLIVVETSGRADYAGTRAFYERHGYRAAARIPDFYAPDDDQVVYVKVTTGAAPEGGG
jgi:ribosomal protein S18 acetylase RimI-like enzyme